jgi:hypothetical protein
MSTNLKEYMNFSEEQLEAMRKSAGIAPIMPPKPGRVDIGALQNKKALKLYDTYTSQMFGELDRPKKLWKEIIYRKMIQFSTGLNYNFNNATFNNFELLYSFGYLGGISWGYWTTIALLQYYLDPRWVSYPSVPNFGREDFYDNGSLHRRIDGESSSLSHTAATGLMGVLLPNGLSSFKMSFKKTRRYLSYAGTSEDVLGTLEYIEIIANEMLRDRLNDVTKKYYSKVTALLSDYLDYGTCMAIMEPCEDHFDLTYIPFVQAGLASTDYDLTQIGSWIQPLPLVNMYANNLENTGGVLNGFMSHFFIPGDQIGDKKEKYFELTQIGKYSTNLNLEPHLIREIPRYKHYSPLLVARLADKGQMYGVGLGLRALNNIVLANYYSNCSKLAAMSSFYPAGIFSQDAEVRQNNRSSGNLVDSDYTDIISAMPGSKITVGANPGVTPTGMPPYTVISKPPEQMSVFSEAASKCLESIASTYMATLLDRLATIGQKRDITAEEIIRQDNRDSQRFKAVIEPFYCGILQTLVEATASSVVVELINEHGDLLSLVRESDNQFLLKNDFAIDLHNYENKQISGERMNAAMQYTQMMQNMGLQPDPKVLGIINNLAKDTMK